MSETARRPKSKRWKKEDEDIIEEPDGYQWSNPKEGPCRGCELEPMTGRACTIHTTGARL